MGNMDSPDFASTAKKWTVIAGILFVIGIAAAGTYYTSTTNKEIPNNKRSKDRLNSLDEAMRSIMGPKWPYVLLVMVLLVAMSLFGLYLASKRAGINITLSDQQAHRLNVAFIAFVVIFGIVMLVMTINEYNKYNREQQNGDNPNYKPNIQQRKKDLQIMVIIGGGLLLFIGGGLAIWYFFLGGRKQMKK